MYDKRSAVKCHVYPLTLLSKCYWNLIKSKKWWTSVDKHVIIHSELWKYSHIYTSQLTICLPDKEFFICDHCAIHANQNYCSRYLASNVSATKESEFYDIFVAMSKVYYTMLRVSTCN